MGGLGRDARNKLELKDNATVEIGSATQGNLLVGGVVAISNTNPFKVTPLSLEVI